MISCTQQHCPALLDNKVSTLSLSVFLFLLLLCINKIFKVLKRVRLIAELWHFTSTVTQVTRWRYGQSVGLVIKGSLLSHCCTTTLGKLFTPCVCKNWEDIGQIMAEVQSAIYNTECQLTSSLRQRKAQNLQVHVMFNTCQSNSHMVLKQLHWLHTEHGINFEIAVHYIQFFTLLTACMFTIPPVLSHYCSFHKVLQYQSTHHSVRTQHQVLVASLSHLLKCGILCLQLCTPANVPTLSTGTSRLTTSSKTFSSRQVPPFLHLRFDTC